MALLAVVVLVPAPPASPAAAPPEPARWGDLDPSFDYDGKVLTSMGATGGEGKAVAVQTDGKIVVAGTAGFDFALYRYRPDGSLDGTFGDGGKVTTTFPPTGLFLSTARVPRW